MKPLFVFLFSFFVFNSLAQDFRYRFKIENVHTLAQAKEVTIFLRPLFNTEEEPNKFFPQFILESAEFNFNANIDISEKDLENQLNLNGYLLLSFYRENL